MPTSALWLNLDTSLPELKSKQHLMISAPDAMWDSFLPHFHITFTHTNSLSFTNNKEHGINQIRKRRILLGYVTRQKIRAWINWPLWEKWASQGPMAHKLGDITLFHHSNGFYYALQSKPMLHAPTDKQTFCNLIIGEEGWNILHDYCQYQP